MGRSILAAALAAGAGLLVATAATAQTTQQLYATALPSRGEAPEAADPSGATYIPGVGFRYVVPGSRVYGYRAVVPAYGYRGYRRACGEPSWWDGGRCARRWR